MTSDEQLLELIRVRLLEARLLAEQFRLECDRKLLLPRSIVHAIDFALGHVKRCKEEIEERR